MHMTEVKESRHWENKVTGARASIYGAVPWYNEKDAHDWTFVSDGWTWEWSDGTIGHRQSVKTREEAEVILQKNKDFHSSM